MLMKKKKKSNYKINSVKTKEMVWKYMLVNYSHPSTKFDSNSLANYLENVFYRWTDDGSPCHASSLGTV